MKTIQYYMMRHAAYYDPTNQFVSYWGMLALKSSMDEFRDDFHKKFPNKKLRIIHSTLPRATHTALLVRDILTDIKTFLRSDPHLNSDKLLITQRYIEEVVSICEEEKEVCLILSHEPDIEYFCGRELNLSQYLCMTITIGEKHFEEEKEKDELPF